MPQANHPLDEVFHPRSVAVVGATPRSPRQGIGAYIAAMVALGYQDAHALYPVNRSAEPVDGLPAYASLQDCPGPIDHVISQVPAQAVPALVEECIAAKVRSVHFFTAGFGETGDAAQAAVEQKFVARLKGAGIRVIGPNCLGMYVPDEKVTFMPGFPAESGNVLVLSQSGSNAAGIVRGLAPRGVRFSKVISYGNGSDVAAAELLDYALADPQTEVVAAYLEGMAEGRGVLRSPPPLRPK
jgi:acyl-CoA synthetase (NDP forming)